VFSEAKNVFSQYIQLEDITVQKLLEGTNPSKERFSAQVLEYFIAKLGRYINDKTSTAWIQDAKVERDEPLKPFLTLHSLSYTKLPISTEYPKRKES
jgi:hypothetical protein